MFTPVSTTNDWIKSVPPQVPLSETVGYSSGFKYKVENSNCTLYFSPPLILIGFVIGFVQNIQKDGGESPSGIKPSLTKFKAWVPESIWTVSYGSVWWSSQYSKPSLKFPLITKLGLANSFSSIESRLPPKNGVILILNGCVSNVE